MLEKGVWATMKPQEEISTLEVVVQCLGFIWLPATEAVRLREQLDVHSLEETAIAAERTGCEVCLADLPEKVSGFAEIIEGKPYIVLNRSKSRKNLQYTLSHELGHQVLHLNPLRRPGQSELRDFGMEEWQAHLFATSWIIWLGNEEQRDEVLQGNLESFVVSASCIFISVLIVVVALLFYIFSKLSPKRRPALSE